MRRGRQKRAHEGKWRIARDEARRGIRNQVCKGGRVAYSVRKQGVHSQACRGGQVMAGIKGER